MRHALFRGDDRTEPVFAALLAGAPALGGGRPPARDGDRRRHRRFPLLCWQELAASLDQDAAATEATEMLVDLYRYIALIWASRRQQSAVVSRQVDLDDLPLGLLDRVHLVVMRSWPQAMSPTSIGSPW